MRKRALSLTLALALCLSLAVPALAAETTIYLDGYQIQEDSANAKVAEVQTGGQLSLKGDLTRTGEVELREFTDSAEIYTCPVYTAKGPVTVTVVDGYVPGEETSGTDEDGDIWVKLAVATAQIDSVSYDAAKKTASLTKENALYFDGKITYQEGESEEGKTVTIQEFYETPDIWDRIGAPPSIHKGAKATLTEPGTYCVSVYYEALAGGCLAYVIIPAPAEETPEEDEKPAEPETPVNPFTDVAESSPFYKAILWAVEQKITSGKTETTFAPGEPCSRAQIVTFLWRAAGSPEPKSMEAEYTDVTDTGAYYYKAVQWAAEMDMEYAGTFDPNAPCNRAAAVYFIWKAGSSPKAETKATFTDLPETPADGSQYYWPDLLDAVNWAVEQGVTAGTGDGSTFSAEAPCTRGQIVTFLYRNLAK